MIAVIAIVALQIVIAALLFGTVLLDRHAGAPDLVPLRRRAR